MKYLCLIVRDTNTIVPDSVLARAEREHFDFGESLRRSGLLTAGAVLDTGTAVMAVTVNQGTVQIDDELFSGTKEELTGFYIVDTEGQKEAGGQIEIEVLAQKIPPARFGAVELWPVRGSEKSRELKFREPIPSHRTDGPILPGSQLRYLFLIYNDTVDTSASRDVSGSGPTIEQIEYESWLTAGGYRIAAGALAGPDQALRLCFDHETAPVVSTGSWLSGRKTPPSAFFYIRAKDLNEALQIAVDNPAARNGTIEIRPVRIPEQRMEQI